MAEWVSLTIKKRMGIARKSIYEIKTIIEDSRSKVVGGIKTGILLWKSCVQPFLLNNCSSWLDIRKADMDKLVKLQNLFLNVLLDTYNCPASLMYFDLALLTIPNQILREKLMLYHHIHTLPDSAIAKKVLILQKKYKFPGLQKELESFLIKHEIVDVSNYSKKEWKVLIDRKITSKNREELIED